MDDRLIILQGDALAQLKTLPDESVHMCCTSPPYWGLRNYGVEGQLGLEKTPEEYIAKMVAVFAEVKRVLRKDGVCFVNIGDSYAGGGNNRGNRSPLSDKQSSNGGAIGQVGAIPVPAGLKPKDLCGMPWRLAFTLQADGWWLRSDIIWHKPNPMPESVTDRPTKSHEYIFLLSKSADYFYDQEAVKELGTGRCAGKFTPDKTGYKDGFEIRSGFAKVGDVEWHERNKRTVWTVPEDEWQQFLEWKRQHSGDKKDIWTVPSYPYSEAHFACFPPDLIKPCILAGTSARGCCAKCGAPWERVFEPTGIDYKTQETIISEKASNPVHRAYKLNGKTHQVANKATGGWRPTCQCTAETVPCTVLDPFGGSGTTGMVALELGRNAILIELNPEYIELARRRCNVTIGFNF